MLATMLVAELAFAINSLVAFACPARRSVGCRHCGRPSRSMSACRGSSGSLHHLGDMAFRVADEPDELYAGQLGIVRFGENVGDGVAGHVLSHTRAVATQREVRPAARWPRPHNPRPWAVTHSTLSTLRATLR